MIKEVLLQIVIIVSNILQVVAGFGGNMIAVPLGIRLVDLESVKCVLNTFSTVGCIALMVQTRKDINKKETVKMTAGMLLGMVIGVLVIRSFSLDYLLYFYGGFVIIVGFIKLFVKKTISVPKLVLTGVILIAGIIHGMFLSGGTMLVIYAISAITEKKSFRATMNAVWVITGVIYVVYDAVSGNFTKVNILRSVVGTATLLISMPIGNYLFRKISQKKFLVMTYVLIILAGASMFL